jgi:hypothetical protein
MHRRLLGTLFTLLFVLFGTLAWTMPAPVAAQEATPHTTPTTRQVVLELRGQPLHWLSFTVAEYYLDNIINGHMNGAIWRFYADNTLEVVGGAGMPTQLKRLSGTYTYDAESNFYIVTAGTEQLEPSIADSRGGIYGMV